MTQSVEQAFASYCAELGDEDEAEDELSEMKPFDIFAAGHHFGRLSALVDDDETLVTREWLESVGFNGSHIAATNFYLIRDGETSLYLGMKGNHELPESGISAAHVGFKEMPTRGQVRMLCRALGMELKESE